LLAIEIVLKGPWYRVISPRLFQYIAGFTENSNDYIIVWDPTPPKASSDYWCLISLLALLVERPKCPEKTIDLPLFADILYHVILYRIHIHMGKITLRTQRA
jgi:hypothetical protein